MFIAIKLTNPTIEELKLKLEALKSAIAETSDSLNSERSEEFFRQTGIRLGSIVRDAKGTEFEIQRIDISDWNISLHGGKRKKDGGFSAKEQYLYNADKLEVVQA